jgi:hypothetical protein
MIEDALNAAHRPPADAQRHPAKASDRPLWDWLWNGATVTPNALKSLR